MSENKITTYLLYAIGEITLVVIGILIAVSIDNWNEEINNQKLQSQFLELLKIDLQRDTIHFNQQIKKLSFQLEILDSLGLVLSDPSANEQTLRKNIRAISPYLFALFEDRQLNTAAYSSLSSSGKLDILPQNLQNQLASLKSNQEKYKEYISDNSAVKIQYANEFISKIPADLRSNRITLSEKLSDKLWEGIEWYETQVSFLNFLQIIEFGNETAIKLTQTIKIESERTLELIEKIQTEKEYW